MTARPTRLAALALALALAACGGDGGGDGAGADEPRLALGEPVQADRSARGDVQALASAPGGDTVWLSLRPRFAEPSDPTSVVAVDPATGAVRATREVDPPGHVLLPLPEDERLLVGTRAVLLRASDLTPVRELDATAYTGAYDPSRQRVLLPARDAVVAHDARDGRRLAELSVERPAQIAYDAAGDRILVVSERRGGADLVVLDAGSGDTVRRIALDGCRLVFVGRLLVDGDGRRALMTCGRAARGDDIRSIDLERGRVTGNEIATSVQDAELDGERDRLVVLGPAGTVVVSEWSGGRLRQLAAAGRDGLGSEVRALSLDPASGRVLAVTRARDGALRLQPLELD